MREYPILFKGPMVRSILRDTKRQTRRLVKLDESGRALRGKKRWHLDDPEAHLASPYGQPGDQLWVKETFQPILADGVDYAAANYKTGKGYSVSYPATDGRIEFYDLNKEELSDRCTPSIFMPRWASRILLEVTSTRVERLQAISGMDAKREGVTIPSHLPQDGADLDWARREFQSLWSSINGEESWNANPWVWVISFHRVTAEKEA